VQSNDLASVYWIGHCASAESFGKAWDTWRTELSDSKSGRSAERQTQPASAGTHGRSTTIA